MAVAPVKMLTAIGGTDGRGISVSRAPGELYVPNDEGTRERMIAAGQATEPIGMSGTRRLPEPKTTVKHRPDRIHDHPRVMDAQAKLQAIELQQRDADTDLADAHERLSLYRQTDTLAADAAALLNGEMFTDETPKLDAAIRLCDRRVKALEELHRRAVGELNAAIGKTRDEICSAAGVAVAEIRSRAVKAIEAVKNALADAAELRRRMEAADAPLSPQTLCVTAFDADGVSGALLDEGLLQLAGEFRPHSEYVLLNVGPPKGSHPPREWHPRLQN